MKDKIELLVPLLCKSLPGINAVNMIIFAENYSQTHDQPDLTLGLDTEKLKSICRASAHANSKPKDDANSNEQPALPGM